MFSQMIQNLLNSSGQQVAQQRLTQLGNYANSYNLRPKSVNTTSESANVQSFQDVLKSSSPKFGTLLTNSSVNAALATDKTSGVAGSGNDYANVTRPQILSMISQIAKKHGVDEKLVKAVIKQESGFNPKATSHCGAAGLMQLMPATAKGFGVTDIYNPVQNVEAGVTYLGNLLKKYNGNVILTLAAYNAGSGAVAKYNGVPPYKETQNYVRSILANYLG